MSDGVTGSEGGGGRLMSVGADILVAQVEASTLVDLDVFVMRMRLDQGPVKGVC